MCESFCLGWLKARISTLSRIMRYRAIHLSVFFVFVLICFRPFHVHAETPVTADITSDTTWGPDGGPYIVSGAVNIPAGITLTILPGTTVEFSSNPGAYSGLNVQGSLVADGNPGAKIYFTSDRDASIEGSSAAAAGGADDPAPRDYRGLSFAAGSTGDLQDVEVRYADEGIVDDAGSVNVTDSVVADSNDGVIVREGTLTLTDDTFTDNTDAVTTDLLSLFTHSGTTISGNYWMNAISIEGASGATPVLDDTDHLPYVFKDDGYRQGLRTLTIEAGVSVYINDNLGATQLQFVNGQQLVVQGTHDAPVNFQDVGILVGNGSSASFEHANFDPNIGQSAVTAVNNAAVTVDTTTVTRGGAGFIFTSGATGVITNSSISGAETGIVGDNSGEVSVQDTTVDGTTDGLVLKNGSHFTATRVTVSNATDAGILLDSLQDPAGPLLEMTHSHVNGGLLGFRFSGGTAVVTSSDIHGQPSGAEAQAAGSYDMRSSWWGDASGPHNDTQNPKGIGAAVSDGILFDPWLGSLPLDTDVPLSDPVATAAGHRVPVIIVPGIMGTKLSKKYGDMGEIWPAVDTLIASPSDDFLDDLSLGRDGTEDPSRPMAVGDIIRSIQPPVGSADDTFDGLISTFETAGYVEGTDLFVFPYDWRLSLDTDAAQLKAKIDSVISSSGAPQVDIIAHSLGGLVVKDYISESGSADIQSLAFIGTPHLGAPKAAKTILYGDDMGISFGPIHILNPTTMQTLSQNMPSVYDLLPSFAYGGAANASTSLFSQYKPGTPILGQDYFYTKSAIAGQTSNINMLNLAEQLHSKTDSQDIPNTAVYNFVGCGDAAGIGKTVGGIVVKNRLAYGQGSGLFAKDYQVLYTNGDGTVPLFSAESSVGTRYYIRNVSHSELPSAPGVPQTLLSLFTGAPVSDTGAVTRYEPPCDLPGTVISTHGPVALSVSDGLGNTAGETADGDVAVTIPGVSYDKVGDASFVFVPEGTDYAVDATPLDPIPGDTYDVYVDGTDANDAVIRRSYFHAIPVAAAGIISKIGYYQLDSDSNPPTVSVGAGNDIETVYPSSTTTGDQAIDTTPPSTAASMADGKIQLDASDDSSGVLMTDYSFDGDAWTQYTEPVTPDGPYIHFASTDNAGNVESQETFSVPQDTGSAVAQDAPSDVSSDGQPSDPEATVPPEDPLALMQAPVEDTIATPAVCASDILPSLPESDGISEAQGAEPIGIPSNGATVSIAPQTAVFSVPRLLSSGSAPPVVGPLHMQDAVKASVARIFRSPTTNAMVLASEVSATAMSAIALNGSSYADSKQLWWACFALFMIALSVRIYLWYKNDQD